MNSATIVVVLLATAAAVSPLTAQKQHGHHSANSDSSHMIGAADAAMSGPMSEAARKHLELSPARRATREDSVRAMAVVRQLRSALAKYADTTVAVADGYKMFMPNVKKQRVYHFTNHRNAFLEALRFDPQRPTSILYQRGSDGQLTLIGAMYTAPKRMRAGKLDDRVPLSIARWHKHVNWCLPAKGQSDRWLERRDGMPVFGPESPIATRSACENVGGRFFPSVFGWMIHANVFLSDDLVTVFGHDHENQSCELRSSGPPSSLLSELRIEAEIEISARCRALLHTLSFLTAQSLPELSDQISENCEALSSRI